MYRSLLSVPILLALGGTAAAGPLVKLSKDFTPNPTVTEKVSVKVERGVYVYDLGYKKCDPGGGGNTTKEPAFTFELTDKLPELYIRMENGSGDNAGIGSVVVFPDGTYLCEGDQSDFWFKNWPKGTYKVWFHGPSTGLSAIVRFEMPSRSKEAVAAALEKLPTIKLGAEGANGGTNPAFLKVKATASAEAQDAGLSCASKRQRIMPLALLEISKTSSYFLELPGVKTFVVTADNKCATEKETKLEAGTHTLWAEVPEDGMPKSLVLEADDLDRALAFGDATRTEVGALDQPLVLDGTVRAAERWPSRGWRSCGGAARAPDFYLTSDQPLQKVELSLLWSKKPQALHVYGPLAKMTSGHSVDCGDGDGDKRSYDIFEGTYAVWIGSVGKKDATGDTFHLLVRRTDVELDQMTTLAEIPAELTMKERAYPNHYPYFSNDWKALFTQAPDRLFVYPRTTIEVDTYYDITLAAGEPLLVDWSGDDHSAVRRWDGTSARVKTQLLTTDPPSTIVLPTKAKVKPHESLSTAMSESGPEDDKAIKAYLKLDDKYQDCIYKYLKKHDPTWGTGDTVYRISGGGRVTNVSEEVGKRGDKKCGWKKVEKAATKLLKQLNKSRDKRWQKHLIEVRARFGLEK